MVIKKRVTMTFGMIPVADRVGVELGSRPELKKGPIQAFL